MYRHLAQTEQQKYGFANGVILSSSADLNKPYGHAFVQEPLHLVFQK